MSHDRGAVVLRFQTLDGDQLEDIEVTFEEWDDGARRSQALDVIEAEISYQLGWES